MDADQGPRSPNRSLDRRERAAAATERSREGFSQTRRALSGPEVRRSPPPRPLSSPTVLAFRKRQAPIPCGRGYDG